MTPPRRAPLHRALLHQTLLLGPLLLPALLLARPSAAALPDEERLLSGAVLAVGFASDGSLCNPGVGLGMVFDPDGGAGPAPLGGDVLLPGRCFEAWALSTGDGRAWVQAEADQGSDLDVDVAAVETGAGLQALEARAEDPAFSLRWQLVLREDEGLLLMHLRVEAREALPGLALSRAFDPDLDAWSTGDYGTANSVLDDVVLASSAFDDRAVALAAPGGAGGLCRWCALPDALAAGGAGADGDEQLGVWIELGELAAGDVAEATFAYAVGAEPRAVAEAAWAAAAAEDLDGDGSPDAADCAPLDPARAPGAAEQANGQDDDCDGEVDEVEGDGAARAGWASPGAPEEDGAKASACASGPRAPVGLRAVAAAALILPLRRSRR